MPYVLKFLNSYQFIIALIFLGSIIHYYKDNKSKV